MKLSATFAMTALVALIGAGAALAQTTAPATPAAPKPAATAPAATTMPMDKAAISKKCSADADAKGLHGSARKKFRKQCITAAMKK